MAGYFYLDGTYYNQMPKVLLAIFVDRRFRCNIFWIKESVRWSFYVY
jgi:hypothetical protein